MVASIKKFTLFVLCDGVSPLNACKYEVARQISSELQRVELHLYHLESDFISFLGIQKKQVRINKPKGQ